MKLIRKLIATWPAAAALCAVIAFALAVTVSAAGSHRSQPASTASAQTRDVSAQTETVSDIALTPQAVTPSAPCTAARQAVTKALADEKAEDATEKTNAKKAGAAVTDVGEDKTEQATLKPLSDAVRAAWAGHAADRGVHGREAGAQDRDGAGQGRRHQGEDFEHREVNGRPG